MISVIIPFHNEEERLIKSGERLAELGLLSQLIFVDGQSSDNSVSIAGRYGQVFKTPKNRAFQLNYGASRAQGDILLFLDADNAVSPSVFASIEKKIASGFIGGCLTQRLDDQRPVFRLIEAQGNLRARMSREFYADQGIFVKKEAFFEAGGFPSVPLLEDVLFSRRLRKLGPVSVLKDKIQVCARRWQKQGIFKTALFFCLILLLFNLRVPLDKIKRLYPDVR